MSNEVYLDHPTFGLLFRICLADDSQELFTTLYAQRLFFLVKASDEDIRFEPVSRADARMLLESRIRILKRLGQEQEYSQLQLIHRQTFC